MTKVINDLDNSDVIKLVPIQFENVLQGNGLWGKPNLTLNNYNFIKLVSRRHSFDIIAAWNTKNRGQVEETAHIYQGDWNDGIVEGDSEGKISIINPFKKEAKKEVLNPIEFIKYVSLSKGIVSNEAINETPRSFDFVKLIYKSKGNEYDIIQAWDEEDDEYVFLGRWNDGIV